MRYLLTLGMLAALAAPAIAVAPPSQVTMTLAPVRGSNRHGKAVLTEHGNKLTVVIRMSTPQGGPFAAHIHRGGLPEPRETAALSAQPCRN
jgi:Cu/Zn superoxide dismutase